MPAHLKRRHQTWYARLTIPKEVRNKFGGKTELVESLRTDSLREAQRLLGPVLGTWRTWIAEARSSELEVLHLRSIQRAIEHADQREDTDQAFALRDMAEAHAEELERSKGIAYARSWFDRATHQGTDIKLRAEEWLADSQYEAKSMTMHRQHLRLLVDFEPIAENISRREAARFVTEVLRPGRSAATVTKMISTYSQLWHWMADRGHISDPTPWSRQQPLKKSRQGRKRATDLEPTRRPFTETEAKLMMAAVDTNADKHPADSLAVRVMAVTGMRLNEVCSLRTTNVSIDPQDRRCVWLYVHEGKTRSAIRLAPVIDQTTVEMLRSRLAARHNDAEDWFFPEYIPRNKHGSASAPLSQRLRRYRDKQIGEDPTVVGGHSWRHRARTIAERANERTSLINAFFGHNLDTEGQDYIGTESRIELLRIAGALRLPPSLSGFPIA